MSHIDIRKCNEEDILAVGQFYDEVVSYLDHHINYPLWIYKVYPSEESVRAMTAEGSQYICMSGSMMMSMVVSIFILSIGAPGIPGSGLICLSVLITQMHVPVEAIGLIMGIDALCGMFRTMSNCLGDVAVSLIVAKSEKAIDLKTYKDLK